MKQNKLKIILDKTKKILSNVSLKTYLYALGAVAIIALIIINTSSYSKYGKYGSVKGDGKYHLDIEKIAKDYNININPEESEMVDYLNNPDANFTEDLSKSLYLTNLYLEQNGMTDSTLRGKILANIVANYQSQISGKKYTKENLNIIRKENKAELENYYKEVKEAFDNYSSKLKSINITFIDEYANYPEVNDTLVDKIRDEMLTNLQKSISATHDLINNLISIPATERGAEYQLNIINLFSKQIAYYQSLRDIDTDPAKYLILNGDIFVNNFENDLISALEPLYLYFEEFGVEVK